jgi:BirA family biotin operon repressor/biotin-[acetyl-CoA-carboxylase] ligase
MQGKIVEFLKNNPDYVSGEQMSGCLDISRQALWKHIQALRDSGYDILAVPHLGYKLVSVPDRMFASEINSGLRSKLLGRPIYYFDSVSSTMDMAMQLGIKGAPEGTIILAETQTEGRGRLGREWVSPKYKGIYLSLILRPALLPNSTPVLTLLTAVSICAAIQEITGLDPKIKWPNDIFISNRKLGGILTELNAEMDQIQFVVIGLGLNVNNDKRSLVAGATSLKEEKKEWVSRICLLQEIVRKIENNYLLFKEKGSLPVIEQWRNYNITLGRRVKVTLQKEHLEGTAVDIDMDGGLLLRKDSGITRKVMAGDLVHCR